MCKLGITVRHMGLLGRKGTEDIPQAAEGLVDGAGLFLVLALHLRPSQSLTAGVKCVSVQQQVLSCQQTDVTALLVAASC